MVEPCRWPNSYRKKNFVVLERNVIFSLFNVFRNTNVHTVACEQKKNHVFSYPELGDSTFFYFRYLRTESVSIHFTKLLTRTECVFHARSPSILGFYFTFTRSVRPVTILLLFLFFLNKNASFY